MNTELTSLGSYPSVTPEPSNKEKQLYRLLTGEASYIESKMEEGTQIFNESIQNLLTLQASMKPKLSNPMEPLNSDKKVNVLSDVEEGLIPGPKRQKLHGVAKTTAAVFIIIGTTVMAVNSQKSFWGF